MHVASALKAKVYVAAAKRAVMGAINLPPEQAALLTTNHLEANIHVVSAIGTSGLTTENMQCTLLQSLFAPTLT